MTHGKLKCSSTLSTFAFSKEKRPAHRYFLERELEKWTNPEEEKKHIKLNMVLPQSSQSYKKLIKIPAYILSLLYYKDKHNKPNSQLKFSQGSWYKSDMVVVGKHSELPSLPPTPKLPESSGGGNVIGRSMSDKWNWSANSHFLDKLHYFMSVSYLDIYFACWIIFPATNNNEAHARDVLKSDTALTRTKITLGGRFRPYHATWRSLQDSL